MASQGSVSHWIGALKAGDEAAAQRIWERYYARLVALARKKLHAAARGAADEEDVTQNAFNSFFRGVAAGRFPRLDDRDDLWRLLVVITARKAYDQLRHERGRGTQAGAESEERAVERIIGREPSPAFAAQVAEQFTRLLTQLVDASLQRVAVWRMEGYGNDEIAGMLDCSRRTVARKLDAIRIIWRQEEPQP